MASGKWIWENGSIPKNDSFSWSLPGASWTDHEWLFQTLIYPASKAGPVGIILFSVLPILVAAFFIWKLAGRSSYSVISSTAFLTAVFVMCPALTARPQLFDLAFFAYILWAYKSGQRKYLYLIPPVVVIWANMHSAAVLGVAVTLLYALTSHLPQFKQEGLKHEPGEKKLHLIIAGLSFAASLVTPWGLTIYGYVFKTVTDKAFTSIREWQPTPFQEPVILAMAATIIFLVTAGFLISRKPVRLETLVMFLGFICLSLSSFRYFPLAAIPAASLLGELWGDVKNEGTRYIITGLLTGLTVAVLITGVYRDFDQAAIKEGYPVEALNAIVPGEKVLNPYDWGGYLLYKERTVFIDGRADIYRWEGEVYEDSIDKIGRLEVEEVLEKYHPDSVLCRNKSLMDRYMAHLAEWVETYRDEKAVIYKPVSH